MGKNGQQYVVCRLHEGKVEHCPLELPFTPEDQPLLHLKGAHAIHLTGFLEMEDEEELEEDEGMADATATKVAAGRQANAGGATAEEDSEDEEDDSFEEGEEEDDDEDDDEEESDEEEAPPPAKAAKRPTPAAAAPPAKKAKAAAATPVAKAVTPAASTPGTPGANSWTKAEDAKLNAALKKVGPEVDNRWDKIAKEVGTRSKDQCKKRQKQINSAAK